jgi:hypothetical protein
MASLVEHVLRWFHSHTVRFSALPTVTVDSAAVDDETTDWWGDLTYMRALADELLDATLTMPNTVTCPLFESIMARPVLDDQDDDTLVWDTDLAALTNQRHELDCWRSELDRSRRAASWWLGECKREARELVAA